jgi:hypothetical protein
MIIQLDVAGASLAIKQAEDEAHRLLRGLLHSFSPYLNQELKITTTQGDTEVDTLLRVDWSGYRQPVLGFSRGALLWSQIQKLELVTH